MKAHDLAKKLLDGPNLPVVAESRDSEVIEIVKLEKLEISFWNQDGYEDKRPKDYNLYPSKAQCVYLFHAESL